RRRRGGLAVVTAAADQRGPRQTDATDGGAAKRSPSTDPLPTDPVPVVALSHPPFCLSLTPVDPLGRGPRADYTFVIALVDVLAPAGHARFAGLLCVSGN